MIKKRGEIGMGWLYRLACGGSSSCFAHCFYTIAFEEHSSSVQRRICLWRFADWITRLCSLKMSSDHAVFTVRYLEWRKFPVQAISPSLVPGFVKDMPRY